MAFLAGNKSIVLVLPKVHMSAVLVSKDDKSEGVLG